MALYITFVILILVASLLIILVVLVQQPKGGMAANFGASNQVMGVRQTTDFLEKFTWTLSIAILVLSLAATMSIPKSKIVSSGDSVDKAIERSMENNAFDTFQLPAETGSGEGTTEGSGENQQQETPQE